MPPWRRYAGKGGSAPVAGYGALFAGGLAVGLLCLVGYDRYGWPRRAQPQSGPGAMSSPSGGPHRGVSGWLAGTPAGPAHRRRHRAAQLRGGSGHRPVGGERRDPARDPARHRVRAAQRDRGFRDRRAHRRDRGHRAVQPAELGIPAGDGRDRRRADLGRHPRRALGVQPLARRPVPHPGGRLDPLRRGPAARRRRAGQAARPGRLRTAHRSAPRLRHRRDRDRRGRLENGRGRTRRYVQDRASGFPPPGRARLSSRPSRPRSSHRA